MKRLVGLILAIAALTAIAFASDSKTVSYQSGDETVQGVLYTPTGNGPFPAIIVIHEWWGLNDWVKEQASKLAGEGYAALAIDLYRGKSRKHPMKRTKLCVVFRKTAPSATYTQPTHFS